MFHRRSTAVVRSRGTAVVRRAHPDRQQVLSARHVVGVGCRHHRGVRSGRVGVGGTTSSTSVPNFLPLTVSVFGEALLGSRITLWPRNSIRNDAEAQLVSS